MSALLKHFKKKYVVCSAYDSESNLVATRCVIICNNISWHHFSGVTEEGRILMAGFPLLLYMIDQCRSLGVTKYNLGERVKLYGNNKISELHDICVEFDCNQLNNQNNHSLGLWYNNVLIAFIIGNIMTDKKKLEYEIFIIYVDNKYRNNRYATLLINAIANYPYILTLKRIELEVAETNIAAINLYKKCNFDLIGKRNNYYSFNNVKENALIFEKKIND